MNKIKREEIYSGLFEYLKNNLNDVVIKRFSRQFIDPSKINDTESPCVVMIQSNENIISRPKLNSINRFEVIVFIIIKNSLKTKQTPFILANNIVDNLANIFSPEYNIENDGRIVTSDQVYDVRLTGQIKYSSADPSMSDTVVEIPIEILSAI